MPPNHKSTWYIHGTKPYDFILGWAYGWILVLGDRPENGYGTALGSVLWANFG
jgi:hypothetical protein